MDKIRQRRRKSAGDDGGVPNFEHLKFNNAYTNGSDVSSIESPTTPKLSPGTATPPLPVLARKEDQSVELARKFRFRNLSSRPQSSILDQKSSRDSTFFGFFILFWVTVAVIVFRLFVFNYCQKSMLMDGNLLMILCRDLWKVAATDLVLYLSTYFAFFWQLGIKNGYLDWDKTGWIVQNIWQALTLFVLLWFEKYMDFPWIGCVYLVLHFLVLLMKEHSYAFYNGYLWQVYNDLMDAKEALSKKDLNEDEKLELRKVVDFSSDELKMQSTSIPFPKNITLQNFFEYSMFPTLIYQIEYPRTDRIRKEYLFKKVAATFGVFFLMIVVSENYLYPIAMRAMDLRNEPLEMKIREYIFILLDLAPPFILIYLLTFYIIWDAILNAIAELTYFGDREFYGEWWNCIAWDQFAKDWNVPVHRFLLRHVYHSSISAFHISKYSATVCTFLLSSLVHELVMFVIFRKLRGYLFCLQMCQLPLVALSRTKFMRGRHILGNTVFWFGIVTGPSIMCSLYLTF